MILFLLNRLLENPAHRKEKTTKKLRKLAEDVASSGAAEQLSELLEQKDQHQQNEVNSLNNRLRTVILATTLFLIAASAMTLFFMTQRIIEKTAETYLFFIAFYFLFDSLLFFLLRQNRGMKEVDEKELLKIAADEKFKAFLKSQLVVHSLTLEANNHSIQQYRSSLLRGFSALALSLLLVFMTGFSLIAESTPQPSQLINTPIQVKLEDADDQEETLKENLAKINGTLRYINYNLIKLSEKLGESE